MSKHILHIMGIALFSTLTTAGSIFAILKLVNGILDLPVMFAPTAVKVLLMLALFPVPFLAGGLWGAGLAWFMKQPMKPVAKAVAFRWGGSFIITTILLDLTQIPIFASVKYLSFSRHIVHYLFTLVFVPAMGVVVMLNVKKIMESFGIPEAKVTGRWAGLAAAVAFLITSLILLFGFQWEVAGPYAGTRYSMLSIMHVCNAVSALAAGTILGLGLIQRTSEINSMETK